MTSVTTRAPTSARTPAHVRAPRWATFGSLATTLAGLGVSAYLTVSHYTTTVTLACPENATINCEKVTTSAQSMFLGIPVAVLGLAYFAAMALLCTPAAWRAASPLPRLIRVLASLVGVGFVAYLVYAELFVINAICLWCTSVHVLAMILFALTAFGGAATTTLSPDLVGTVVPRPDRRQTSGR
jgi:uncharacterized membrane protein